MRLTAKALTIAALSLSLLNAACAGGGGTGDGPVVPGKEPAAAGVLQLQGAGASFPNPLYTKWFSEYNKKNSGVKIDYQSIGSGGGIKQITERTVDFGASDAPMTDEQLKAAPKEIVHIPTVLGAVVVIYNLDGVASGLKLDGPTTADIFMGNIKTWNDPKIAALNPGTTLPATEIGAAHRSDGSGTTAIFADYLAKISPEWKDKMKTGTQLEWPGGMGFKGNDGVAGFVKGTKGAIGYVELIYAEQNKIPYASIKNANGEFVAPSLDAVTAAAAGASATIPEDLRVSITNAPGAGAYPISGFTYLLVYKDQDDAAKGKALADFVWWALNDGTGMAKELTYSPLPADVLAKAKAKVKLLNSGGKAFIQ